MITSYSRIKSRFRSEVNINPLSHQAAEQIAIAESAPHHLIGGSFGLPELEGFGTKPRSPKR